MHDSMVIPACFTSGERPPPSDEPTAAIRSGQSLFMSVYRTKIAGQSRLITITWCKNLLLRGLSVSIHGQRRHGRDADGDGDQPYCEHKIELKPWYFWRRQGEKQLVVLDGKTVNVVWDLKAARFSGETEPQSDYYVAIVCDDQVALLVGDMKKDAFRRTGCPPSLVDPVLVTRKEHLFGKRKFSTRARFDRERTGGEFHAISIECNNVVAGGGGGGGCNADGFESGSDPELEVRIDGKVALRVRHLHWKFRGNEVVRVGNVTKVEVFWDVHDWLFGSGTRHGMFIFSPLIPSSSSSSMMVDYDHDHDYDDDDHHHHGDNSVGGSSRFSLFVYAWKVE